MPFTSVNILDFLEDVGKETIGGIASEFFPIHNIIKLKEKMAGKSGRNIKQVFIFAKTRSEIGLFCLLYEEKQKKVVQY